MLTRLEPKEISKYGRGWSFSGRMWLPLRLQAIEQVGHLIEVEHIYMQDLISARIQIVAFLKDTFLV